jgi:hypothetical protein
MQKYFYISVLLFIFSSISVVKGETDSKAFNDQLTFTLSSEGFLFRSGASKNHKTYLAPDYTKTKGFVALQKKDVSGSIQKRYAQAMYSSLSDYLASFFCYTGENKCTKAHRNTGRNKKQSRQICHLMNLTN